MPATFWERFFDSDYRQRTDIGRLQDAEEQASYDLSSQAAHIARLESQLHELALTMAALMKVMSEMGQLDPRSVKLRVDAELEAMRPPAPLRPVVEAHPVKQKLPDFAVRCAQCGTEVPSSRTTITAAGTVCDQCAERAR